jgi:predicted Co/Zn/Cd cation transporter (cation efflux family)
MIKDTSNETIERRSLTLGKWGNLLMAVSGVAAAFLSRSDALLVDGLYSGVNFLSAIVAARITLAVARPADRRYPFGYDAFEALYVKYRSMVLIGIMAFAVFGALGKIVTYATGGDVPELVFGPILVYSVVMVALCLGLAMWHHHNWKQSGRQSEILCTESRAAVVDAVISAGAGGGLLSAALLRGTVLGFLVPVADAIVVLVMCAFIGRQPIQMFLGSLREVAGAAADPPTVTKVRRCLEESLRDRPFALLEVAVTKIGRAHFVVTYVKPDVPVDGKTADAVWEHLDSALRRSLGQVRSEIIVAGSSPYEMPDEATPPGPSGVETPPEKENRSAT